MKAGFFRVLAVGLVLWNSNVAKGTPVALTVTPKGAGQVEFAFKSIVPGVEYIVLARTNASEGHWVTFPSSPFVSTNTSLTTVRDLGGEGGVKGLAVNNLKKWSFIAGTWDDTDGDGLPDL